MFIGRKGGRKKGRKEERERGRERGREVIINLLFIIIISYVT